MLCLSARDKIDIFFLSPHVRQIFFLIFFKVCVEKGEAAGDNAALPVM